MLECKKVCIHIINSCDDARRRSEVRTRLRGSGGGNALGKLLEKLTRNARREVNPEGGIHATRRVLTNAGDVLGGGGDEINGRDVRDGVTGGVELHVKGDAFGAEIGDAEERRDDLARGGVVDEHLPHVGRIIGKVGGGGAGGEHLLEDKTVAVLNGQAGGCWGEGWRCGG